MKITYLGTSVLLFDDGKDQILFDAHVSRPSIFKLLFCKNHSKKNVVNKIKKDFKIDRLSAVFVSHTHIDHVLDLVSFMEDNQAICYGSESARNILLGGNITRFKKYQYGQSYQVGDFSIKVIKSLHSKTKFYNNDLGKVIDKPLKMPAKKKDFKEGNSCDFLITHQGKTFLIRPSFNYIINQYQDLNIDYLFLGINGLSRANKIEKENFFKEVIAATNPKTIIPIHYDNFFRPIYSYPKMMPLYVENSLKSMHEVVLKALDNRQFLVLLPLCHISL